MAWFKTTKRKVYRRPREKSESRGWYRKTKFRTKVKRWAKRNTKKQWRKAKQDVRRVRRQRGVAKRKKQRQRDAANRKAARQYQPKPRAKPTQPTRDKKDTGPPPDGAIGTCRNCGNEVQYNGGRSRWEHTGKGNASCFGR